MERVEGHAGWRAIVILGLCVPALLGGCGPTGQAPWGPGAATQTDLRPWTEDAPSATLSGYLQNFNVASQRGSYVTWSIHDANGVCRTAEVDVRECQASAELFRDQRVIITGRILEREADHFPLLVAEQISPLSPENLTPEQHEQWQLVMLDLW